MFEFYESIDSLISGIALNRNQSILTNNVKHFTRVKELKIESY